jgi:hypothetical protein
MPKQLPPDSTAPVRRIHIQPREAIPIISRKAHDPLVDSRDEFMGALETLSIFLIVSQRNEGPGITRTLQLDRSCPVMHRADRKPVGIGVSADGNQNGALLDSHGKGHW